MDHPAVVPDHGTTRQERGLKHRAAHETRTIPVPPELVKLLRAHIRRYGTTPDGRIFHTARGGMAAERECFSLDVEQLVVRLPECRCRGRGCRLRG